MKNPTVMKTYYIYIALFAIGVILLVRYLYIQNEKDKKKLEDQMNNDYKKIQEIETNDKDMIN
jgi:hypothetical protein